MKITGINFLIAEFAIAVLLLLPVSVFAAGREEPDFAGVGFSADPVPQNQQGYNPRPVSNILAGFPFSAALFFERAVLPGISLRFSADYQQTYSTYYRQTYNAFYHSAGGSIAARFYGFRAYLEGPFWELSAGYAFLLPLPYLQPDGADMGMSYSAAYGWRFVHPETGLFLEPEIRVSFLQKPGTWNTLAGLKIGLRLGGEGKYVAAKSAGAGSDRDSAFSFGLWFNPFVGAGLLQQGYPPAPTGFVVSFERNFLWNLTFGGQFSYRLGAYPLMMDGSWLYHYFSFAGALRAYTGKLEGFYLGLGAALDLSTDVSLILAPGAFAETGLRVEFMDGWFADLCLRFDIRYMVSPGIMFGARI